MFANLNMWLINIASMRKKVKEMASWPHSSYRELHFTFCGFSFITQSNRNGEVCYGLSLFPSWCKYTHTLYN